MTAAESLLTAERERYHDLFETAPVGYLVTDKNGVILQANQAALKMLGRQVQGVVGNPLIVYVPQQQRQSFYQALHTLQSQGTASLQLCIDPPSGPSFDAELTAAVERLPGDSSPQLRWMLSDVSQRKRAEEVLRESEQRRAAAEAMKIERQRLFDVLETLPAMVCLLTPDYHVAFANRSFREKFGESDGRHCYEYCFGRTAPCDFCESYKALETGQPHHWEVKGPDGSVIEAHDFPFTDVDGSRLILEMDVDVTEQRKAQESLRRVSQYVRSLIEASLDPLVTISAEGKITDVNEAAIKATGVPRQELIGTDFATYFTEPEKAQAGYRQVFASGSVTDYPLTICHKDGHLTDVLYNAAVYRDGSGKVLGVFAAARDVTERKRAEAELENYRHHLEELVEERTNQLAAAAAEAQQLAAEATQATQTIRRLSVFPEENPNPVLRIARDGTILYANPVSGPLLAHWGLAGGQCLPEDWARQLAAITDAGKPVEQEVECAGKVFSCLVTPIAGEEYVNIYGRDITDRKRREEQLAKLTRLYVVLSQVNEAIVRAHDVQTLYGDVCRIVAEKGGFPLVWIGQLDGRRVVPAAAGGPSADYLDEIDVQADGELGRGPTGTCVRENRAVVNDDFEANPATEPWRETAGRYGFRASAAFPLRGGGKPVAALTLYAADPYAFDAEQVGLFESLTADLSYAIDAIDHEHVRKRAEATLRTTMQRFYSTLSSMYGSILLVSNEGKVEFANQSFCDLFEFEISPKDLIGLGSDEVIGRIKDRYDASRRGGSPHPRGRRPWTIGQGRRGRHARRPQVPSRLHSHQPRREILRKAVASHRHHRADAGRGAHAAAFRDHRAIVGER